MRPELRRSLPAKVIALSFILLILLGNLWVVERLLGHQPRLWMQLSFLFGLLGAFGGGLWLAGLAFRLFWQAKAGDHQLDKDEEQ